jgi:hypothetical protein
MFTYAARAQVLDRPRTEKLRSIYIIRQSLWHNRVTRHRRAAKLAEGAESATDFEVATLIRINVITMVVRIWGERGA